jgi:dihydroorotate dehydrogenase (NAD+) catalytic subunit
VQVGTANFIDPAVSVKIVEGIEAYLRKNKIGKVTELTGGLRTE